VTYRLQFTEKMIGAFAFGETDYRAGYDGGQGSGSDLMFRLTIATDDVYAFIGDPGHLAVAQGYVQSDVLGGRRTVEAGVFNLFVDEGPRTRHMLYRLYFSDATGRPLTLAGYKDVRPGPITRVWPETSTLYVHVLTGHVPVTDGGAGATDGRAGATDGRAGATDGRAGATDGRAGATGGIVGSGVLRIRPLDFARQLTTFRVHGPDRMGEFRAFDAFARLFIGELWQVFDPLRRER
jgi:cholesterol oxidase